MKPKTFQALLLATAMTLSQIAAAGEHESKCDPNEMPRVEQSPRYFFELILLPARAAAGFTWGPRCLLKSIPKNEE